LNRGRVLATADRIDEALAAYRDAQRDDPGLMISAAQWNVLCWWGCLFGKAKEVCFAGDQAVGLDGSGPRCQARGLARALTGDRKGAIDDFEAFVQWQQQNPDAAESPEAAARLVATRRQWIDALRRGENPFTAEELVRLRH